MKGYLYGAGLAAVAIVGLTLYVKGKGGAVQVAKNTYDAVDGAATDAALSIPGMTVFQDPSTGNFDPAAAGYAAGAATRKAMSDWFASTFGAPETNTINGVDMGYGANDWNDAGPATGAQKAEQGVANLI
ncbi:hypothetical protein BGV68_01945 [Burkholderia ubonensis]|nr:hypothetical protein BGV68_01945 [Burkholderia ubonensis]